MPPDAGPGATVLVVVVGMLVVVAAGPVLVVATADVPVTVRRSAPVAVTRPGVDVAVSVLGVVPRPAPVVVVDVAPARPGGAAACAPSPGVGRGAACRRDRRGFDQNESEQDDAPEDGRGANTEHPGRDG